MLTNATRNIALAEDVSFADTHLKRLRGLIGRPLKPGQALVIRPSTGIHTFFMGYPIDAIYVDADGRVLKLVHGIRPYRFGPIDLRTRDIIELPEGTLKRTATAEGDTIAFR